MPEGDTVWLAGRRLDAALASQLLTRTDFRVPQLAATDLAGHRVREVVSRGKHLLARIEPDLTLHTHFRMDGAWHLYRPGERWRGGPDHQVRAVLETRERVAVGYRLPVVELVPTAAESEVVGHLGPDLLGPGWDPAEALRRLTAEPDREIGVALRDQRVLAGLGNLYTAEALYLHGVTPWMPVRDVPDLPRLLDRAHRLLDANKERAAQVTTGRAVPSESHWVFERSGRPCLRCGTPVTVAWQDQPPRERLTYWCARCQQGPAPAPLRRQDKPKRPAGRTRYRP